MILDIKKAMDKVSILYRFKICILVCLCIFSFGTHAQNSFLPANLGDNINTTYAEINPVISPDGNTLYFTKIIPASAFGELERQEIWYSEKESNGNWGQAKRMGDNLNIGRFNSILSVSGDGQTLLINGNFNKKGNLWKKRGLSTVQKNGDVWGSPVKLKVKKFSKQNKGAVSNASMSFDGNSLLLAYSKGYNKKNLDIYISRKKGEKWSKPKKLSKQINSKHSEEAPFLSNNNEKLYFARKKKGSGASDIYFSTKTGDNWKKWSNPEKLSDTINSAKWDSYFKTNLKGNYGYFSSENNSKGWSDIYSIKLFEENPYVSVEGFVINSADNKILSPKYTFKIMIDGNVVDSVKIYRDTASFKVRLPFGKKYTLSVALPNFISSEQTIDATSTSEFIVKKQNLTVTPLAYVMVSGKAFQTGTNEVIPQLARPRIAIDENVIDSISVDSISGEYSFRINYGKSYKIKVVANNYRSTTEVLDLTEIVEYEEIHQNLYAEFIKEKKAIVKGIIFDKKLNKPMVQNPTVKIFVNGAEYTSTIDSTNGSYQIELPLENSYTINASAENYYPVFEIIDLRNEKEDIRVLKDLEIVPIEVGQSVRLNNIFFNIAKTSLMDESFAELDRVAQFLKENKNIVVEIGGHTDNVGKATTNMNLSVGRAKSVAKYLISKGVSQGQVKSKGYGVSQPVGDNKTEKGRALNRRVEFTILDK
ncbi:MAG TPA: OmpA family protein [Cytophagales bacterium]|nr:OmpA family protein [Cytophagales bacterium]